MPNLKYSGSKGVVQSTGTGQFHVSGVGVAHDVESYAVDGAKTATSFGVTLVSNITNASVLTIPNPTTVEGAAGQQKLVVVTGAAGGGALTVKNAAEADLVGDNLTAANDYALLVWTGTTWACVAEVST